METKTKNKSDCDLMAPFLKAIIPYRNRDVTYDWLLIEFRASAKEGACLETARFLQNPSFFQSHPIKSCEAIIMFLKQYRTCVSQRHPDHKYVAMDWLSAVATSIMTAYSLTDTTYLAFKRSDVLETQLSHYTFSCNEHDRLSKLLQETAVQRQEALTEFTATIRKMFGNDLSQETVDEVCRKNRGNEAIKEALLHLIYKRRYESI